MYFLPHTLEAFFLPVEKQLLVEKKIIGGKQRLGPFDEIPLGRWPAWPWPSQAGHQPNRILTNQPESGSGQEIIN